MTKKQFSNGMKILKKSGLANTPDYEDDNLDIWFLFLSKYNYKDFIKSILIYISNNTFFPSVHSLLQLVKPQNEYPSKYLIWEIFKNKDHKKIDPLIIKAFKIAGVTTRYMKEMTTYTAFIIIKPKIEKIYQELIDKEENRKQLNNIEKVLLTVDIKQLEGDK